MQKGFSLIEMLVVITVFAILGVLISQIIFLTIRSTNKNEAAIKTRENLNYAIAVMERNIRYAKSIVTPTCDGSSSLAISYVDIYSNAVGTFDCSSGLIASSSAINGVQGEVVPITNSDIVVTCNFSCSTAGINQSPSVEINVSGVTALKDGNKLQSAEISRATVQTRIYLRNN